MIVNDLLKYYIQGKFQDLEIKQAQYLASLKASKERKPENRKKEINQLYEEIQTLQEECSGIALEKVEITNQVHEQVKKKFSFFSKKKK